ncbi:MAG: beta-galactosidase trimerization domain-containing protein [Kiritimatiellae bacterium]|nr:beta-galactosidase trimerization domain-containing protein [Kiritimatiellia bacterium]
MKTSKMPHWWDKEPLRIAEICSCFNPELPLQKEVEAIKRLGANVQHFHCMQHKAGLDETGFCFKTSLSRKENPDLLGEYLPMAHKNGIKVIVYFNVHWYTMEFGKEHPDWQQIKENGKAIDNIYTTGTSFCINGPYRNWVFQIVADLCKYEIDGIFYDGPIFFDSSCYCDTCRRLFRERTGKDMPLKSDRKNPLWKELVEFQADSIARFLSDTNDIVKTANPEIMLCMNCNSNAPYWPTGRDNHRIIKHSDLLGAEGGFLHGDLNASPVYKAGMAARILSRQAQGKPGIVFSCGMLKPWTYYLLPKEEISILLAETLAGGANYWTAVMPENLNQPEMDVITDYNRFVKDNPDPFFQTKSLARIALLWPSATAEVYSGSSIPLSDFTREIKAEGIGDIVQEFRGLYESLAKAQLPLDVIDNENINDLKNYDLLVLPNAACLAAGAIAEISDFVKGGGNLIATFETSLYNGTGQKQNHFQLQELFGVEFTGEIFGKMEWDFVSPVKGIDPAFLKNITNSYIPAPAYGIKVKPTTGTPLIYYRERLKGRYDGNPKLSSEPFLVENRFGKGKVFYLAGTFGQGISCFHFPEYLNLIKNICHKTCAPLVAINNDNASWVEASLRRKGKKVFLHLINRSSGPRRPMTFIQPLTDLKIALSGMDVKEAKALWLNRELLVEKYSETVSLILPSLKGYEVIELK